MFKPAVFVIIAIVAIHQTATKLTPTKHQTATKLPPPAAYVPLACSQSATNTQTKQNMHQLTDTDLPHICHQTATKLTPTKHQTATKLPPPAAYVTLACNQSATNAQTKQNMHQLTATHLPHICYQTATKLTHTKHQTATKLPPPAAHVPPACSQFATNAQTKDITCISTVSTPLGLRTFSY